MGIESRCRCQHTLRAVHEDGEEGEMTSSENKNITNKLESFFEELKIYQAYLTVRMARGIKGDEYSEMMKLREKLVREASKFRKLITELTDKDTETIYEFGKPRSVDIWTMGLGQDFDYRTAETLSSCMDTINSAIGKLQDDIEKGVRDEQGNLIEKPAKNTEQKDTVKFTVQLFDSMQFHPKVIEASRELFEDGHYRDAIYRAFVEVNNFVKIKAKSQLDGRNLMSTVFRLENPIIKLNSLKTQSDKDEQEGFMFLFMGAMEGIRNPKAHENIVQNDPYKALKYLSLASLLIETIDFWEAK